VGAENVISFVIELDNERAKKGAVDFERLMQKSALAIGRTLDRAVGGVARAGFGAGNALFQGGVAGGAAAYQAQQGAGGVGLGVASGVASAAPSAGAAIGALAGPIGSAIGQAAGTAISAVIKREIETVRRVQGGAIGEVESLTVPAARAGARIPDWFRAQLERRAIERSQRAVLEENRVRQDITNLANTVSIGKNMILSR
jgi:hypothetical protein